MAVGTIKIKFDTIANKILSLLRVKEAIGGLEISDAVFRYVYFDKGVWKMTSLRLPPEIIVGGQIKDYAQCVEALKTLRRQIVGERHERRKVSAVVALSSVNIYSQVFSLPMIEGENLEKAIQLNIQMVSPDEISQTYSGWQLVSNDQKSVRLEVLSSFINRAVVDEMTRALKDAGFISYAVESRALALSRLVRDLGDGFDKEGSYVVLSVDTSGLEFLVIRRAQLYFHYFHSWRDIQGDEREISWPVFESAVIRSLHQVINFYNAHWPEPLLELFLIASGLEDAVTNLVSTNFSLRVKTLNLKLGDVVSPEWFVALGSGLRGLVPRREDRDISLLGVSAQEEFRRHQILNFAGFWALLMPVSLSVLLATFLGADIFLVNSANSLKIQADALVGGGESKEIVDLEKEANSFNKSVALIQQIQTSSHAQLDVLAKINDAFNQNGATLTHVSFQNVSAPISLSGKAGSQNQIINLRKALSANPSFQRVDLPLTEIRPAAGGFTFSMSLVVNPPKAP